MQTFDVLVLTIDFAAKVKIKNKMTKEILHKILKEGTSLGINAISVEEKKAMQTFFMDFVFLISTFYLRFFQNVFFEWEIVGIENCKNQF